MIKCQVYLYLYCYLSGKEFIAFHIYSHCNVHSQNDPAIKQLILDEEELKAMQIQKDKRRMSNMSYPRSGRSGRSSRYSRRLGDDDGGDSDDSTKGTS